MKKLILIFIIFFIQTASFANQDIINLINSKLNELGEFKEPTKYPKGFEEKHFKGCKSWKCISDKSANAMGLIFKRTDSYNQKNPGNQIYGMAYFEIFYLKFAIIKIINQSALSSSRGFATGLVTFKFCQKRNTP